MLSLLGVRFCFLKYKTKACNAVYGTILCAAKKKSNIEQICVHVVNLT